MNSLLGQTFVLVGLLACAVGAPLGFAAGYRRSMRGLQVVRRLSLIYAATMVIATLIMWWALLSHDFSVSYVAQVGSLSTPVHITIFSLWSSLEGSILFWGFTLGILTALLAVLQREGHEDYLAYTLGTVLSVGLFFSFMIAGPANPFAATPAPIPTDGPGPNPLLQNHLLMAVHPPLIYLGYVGMTIPFGMAVAALLRGQLGPTWLRPMRNWLLVPTSFLTLAIMLGGWWAYEVLGWGGYWAWDPVENASFLPWLTAIAAVHSAIVQQRRGTLKAWTTILILVTFLLTILGTFLTRSGVVNSVHSFTQSPIGPIFLGFLGITSLFVVVLLAMRVDTLEAETTVRHGTASRESAFLFNNLLLVAVTFTVLVGTLYPILAEAVRGVKVSVGEPWFNRFSIPMFLGLLLLVGIGPALPWGRSDTRSVVRSLLRPVPAALVGLVLALLLGAREGGVLITSAIAGYAFWVTLDQISKPARSRASRGESIPQAVVRSSRLAPRRMGAYLVHLGVVILGVSIAVSSTYQLDQEATLQRNGEMQVADYTLRFLDAELVRDPHVTRQVAAIAVEKDGETLGKLSPSLNFYPTQRNPLGSPSVHSTMGHDLYLTLMNVGQDGSIGLRAIVTPLVAWVWISVFVMFFGTVLCLVPPLPMRSTVRQAADLPAGATSSLP